MFVEHAKSQHPKRRKKILEANARRFARWKIPLAPPLIVAAIILLLVAIHAIVRGGPEERATQPGYALVGGR